LINLSLLLAAARQLDPAKPLFVSGHSLGSPLATLAALDIAQNVPALQDQVRLYTYADPKLGNTEFAEAHSRLVPNNYRVVNLADPVTLLPPPKWKSWSMCIWARNGDLPTIPAILAPATL
jgi:triacylglycerol lipase